MRSAPGSWSTWRISPAWSPPALHPVPLPHAHVVTTTTHKTLRGPRGGMILANDEEIAQEDQLGRVPGPAGRPADARDRRQGGGVRRGAAAGVQALRPERGRQRQGPGGGDDRARLCHRLGRHRQPPDAGRPAAQGRQGQAPPRRLERAGITCNKNGVPFDPEKPTVTSGIRLGTPAGTTRGFGVKEFQDDRPSDQRRARRARPPATRAAERKVKAGVAELCVRFPIYG